MAQQEESFRMIAIEKWITFLLLAFILIIASFNVISTLSMLVIEKDDNIRTLYSLGASRNTIARIFLLEGWLISLLGGVIGIIAGVILSLAQQWGGFIKLGRQSRRNVDRHLPCARGVDRPACSTRPRGINRVAHIDRHLDIHAPPLNRKKA